MLAVVYIPIPGIPGDPATPSGPRFPIGPLSPGGPSGPYNDKNIILYTLAICIRNVHENVRMVSWFMRH